MAETNREQESNIERAERLTRERVGDDEFTAWPYKRMCETLCAAYDERDQAVRAAREGTDRLRTALAKLSTVSVKNTQHGDYVECRLCGASSPCGDTQASSIVHLETCALLSLAERLEQATEGSIELDAYIYGLLEGRDVRWVQTMQGMNLLGYRPTRPDAGELALVHKYPDGRMDLCLYPWIIKPWTTSIDAAVSLIPEDWFWSIEGGKMYFRQYPRAVLVHYCQDRGTPTTIVVEAKTLILATCSAAIRALAASKGSGS